MSAIIIVLDWLCFAAHILLYFFPLDEWGMRFSFHPLTELPLPEPYVSFTKSYPSKSGGKGEHCSISCRIVCYCSVCVVLVSCCSLTVDFCCCAFTCKTWLDLHICNAIFQRFSVRIVRLISMYLSVFVFQEWETEERHPCHRFPDETLWQYLVWAGCSTAEWASETHLWKHECFKLFSYIFFKSLFHAF